MPALVSKPLPRRRESDLLSIRFVTADGKNVDVEAQVGASLLDVAQGIGMPLEGTCEGQMACSTCHVIVADQWFERLPEPSMEEEDMLDLAAGVSRTSRLACQIRLTEAMDGLVIRIPGVSHDMQIG